MQINLRHRKATTRRAWVAALALAMCLVWVGPIHAVCACCASMSEPAALSEESAKADAPSCHAVPKDSTPDESSLPNPIQIKTPCEDNCIEDLAPDQPASEFIAVVNHASSHVVPVAIATAPASAVIEVPRLESSDTSPPALAALSTRRYASSAPLLT